MKTINILYILLFLTLPIQNIYSIERQNEQVQLTYDPNGGKGEKRVVVYKKGSEVVLLSTLEDFTKEGAFLSGWTTAVDGSGTDYNLGDKIKLDDKLTLFAKWTNLSFGCKVTYLLQGSSTRTFLDPNTYSNGTDVIVLENQFNFPGYAFTGFNTKSDGTGIEYQPGDKLVITSDITLYINMVKGIAGPGNIRANVIGTTKFVELNWKEFENVASYKIYYKTDNSDDFILYKEIEAGNSLLLENLNPATIYRFAVSAVINGIETLYTVSNRIETGISETKLLKIPTAEGLENTLSTKIMSDKPFELNIKRINGADYFYTLNGSEPTIQSFKITGDNILINPPQSEKENTIKLKVVAWNDKQAYSPIFSHTFLYEMPKPASDIAVGGHPINAVPEFCRLSTLSHGRIYYTLDGSNPTKNSRLYSEPIPVSSLGTTTIKAIAIRDGFKNSEIAILDFGPVLGGYEWADPHRFAVNREDPRAVFYPYENEKMAIDNHNIKPQNSTFYKSLDGDDWKFKWVRKPFDRNEKNGLISNGINSFEMTEFDDSGWDKMTVPSCWTVIRDENGKFKYDGPAYSAAGYIWNAAFLGNKGAGAPTSPFPPQTNQSTNNWGEVLPDAGTNSVGTYRKTFVIDEDWKDRMVFINLAGVSSNCYIWINGNPVAYAEDRFSNKEFDITPYVKTGENTLAVQVFRWSNGSWIEDQDMNRHAGIFRSVYLLSRPKTWIGDFEIHTYPSIKNEYAGSWNLDVNVLLRQVLDQTQLSKIASLSLTLFDADGKEVAKNVENLFDIDFERKENFLGDPVQLANLFVTINEKHPKLWSAEKPYLYKLVLTLKNQDEILESTCIRVGFREMKVVENNTENARVLFNGSRILLHGTNMHEIDPKNGYTVTEELIRKDLVLMKQNSINAIRMSHYPHHELYYELCDEFGIYVMDEANLECHGSRETNVNPESQKMMQDRQRNMFERDKNHASVVFWSSGNENYEGPDEELLNNFRKNNTQWLRDRDLSGRPVHQSFDNAGADFFGTGYQYPEDLKKTILDLKTPMLQTEYCHNQGNSFGVAREYIEFFENQPKTIGGFIWDWVDQEIYTPVIEDGKITGKKYLGYGKDWNDTDLGGWWEDPSQMSNMGCNGMILTDRTAKPQVAEMKRQYQMINVGMAGSDKFYVNNKYLFTNTNEFDMEWELLENGICIQKSATPIQLDVDPAPSGISRKTMNTAEFPVPFKIPKKINPGAEYFFNLIFKTKSNTKWASAGYPVSENQMLVNFSQDKFPKDSEPKGLLEIDSTDSRIIQVSGEGFFLVIDKSTGEIESFKAKNTSGELQEIFVSGPVPNFFRSPVDGEREAVNMKSTSQAQLFMAWKDAVKLRSTSEVKVNKKEQKVEVNINGNIPVNEQITVNYNTSYTIYPNGEIQVVFDYYFPELDPKKSFVAEIGSIMQIKGGLENITWYGRGPGESYNNRKFGNNVGIWQSTVTEKAFMYPSPQETGNNVETRWLALTDKSGFGLIVKGEPLIDFNATHFAPQELAKSFDPKFSPFVSQMHPYQITKSEDTYLRIIHKGTGVGGINSWGKTPLPEYRINASKKSFTYSYSIVPVVGFDKVKAIDFWGKNYAENTKNKE